MKSVMLSIIIPVYNVYAYLERCVYSVLRQTFQDYEVILIDDGSTDGSGELCDQLAQLDSRIIPIHTLNGGVSRARNVGLSRARGQYIAFVDGDDWIEIDMYDKMFSRMTSHTDIVFCRFERNFTHCAIRHFERNLEKLTEFPADFQYIVYENENEISVDGMFVTDTVFGSVCRSLFRKPIIDLNHIRFPEDVQIAEDRLFIMEYLSKCSEAVLINEYLYHYRADRIGSATTDGSKGYRKNLFNSKKTMLQHEFGIINNNTFIPKNEKMDLITYEKMRLCFDIVINETLFCEEYRSHLKMLFKEDLLKNALNIESFRYMKRNSIPIKRCLFFFLIRMRFWSCIKIIMRIRHK